MSIIQGTPIEAPVIKIETDHEYRIALTRLRELEGASDQTADALERVALEAAIAEFTQAKQSARK